MPGKVFVDTNILVYAYDKKAGTKHKIAQSYIKRLWHEKTGVISTQVLHEFYVTLSRKITHPLSPLQARELISRYFSWNVEINDTQSIIQASEIEEKHHISFWDSLIIASAVNARVAKLITEDLNHGQIIEGIPVENPFFTSKGCS